MQNWVRTPIFICLDKVVKGLGNDNLTKVIMEALTINGGLPKDQIAQKLVDVILAYLNNYD
jgi:hypothetical protein